VVDLLRHHIDTVLQRPELLSNCDVGLGLALSALLLKHRNELNDDVGLENSFGQQQEQHRLLVPEQNNYCEFLFYLYLYFYPLQC